MNHEKSEKSENEEKWGDSLNVVIVSVKDSSVYEIQQQINLTYKQRSKEAFMIKFKSVSYMSDS
jgi:hypothetical protein